MLSIRIPAALANMYDDVVGPRIIDQHERLALDVGPEEAGEPRVEPVGLPVADRFQTRFVGARRREGPGELRVEADAFRVRGSLAENPRAVPDVLAERRRERRADAEAVHAAARRGRKMLPADLRVGGQLCREHRTAFRLQLRRRVPRRLVWCYERRREVRAGGGGPEFREGVLEELVAVAVMVHRRNDEFGVAPPRREFRIRGVKIARAVDRVTRVGA
mmetsp:Transcript_26901/g.82767  ORF Transcript_26901/g.82767 Transcript_26901/m.82767 type:complete len:219 (-) Transcript_26901:643-1299(-)